MKKLLLTIALAVGTAFSAQAQQTDITTVEEVGNVLVQNDNLDASYARVVVFGEVVTGNLAEYIEYPKFMVYTRGMGESSIFSYYFRLFNFEANKDVPLTLQYMWNGDVSTMQQTEANFVNGSKDVRFKGSLNGLWNDHDTLYIKLIDSTGQFVVIKFNMVNANGPISDVSTFDATKKKTTASDPFGGTTGTVADPFGGSGN